MLGVLCGGLLYVGLCLAMLFGTGNRAEAYYFSTVVIEGGLAEVTVESGGSIVLDGLVTGVFSEVPARNRWTSSDPGATLAVIPMGLGGDPCCRREISARFDAPVVTSERTILVTVTVGFAADGVAESGEFARSTDTIIVRVRAAKASAAPLVQAFQTGRINALIQEQPDLSSVFDGDMGGAGLTASTMGDAVAVQAGMGGPVWAEVRGNRSVLGGSDGHYALGAVGAHWQAGPGVVLGLMAMADRMETAEVAGTGWLVGPYAVVRAEGPPLVVQARYLMGDSRNRMADGAVFGSRRSLAMVGLSGHLMQGDLEIVPSLRAAHGREVSDAFVDGAGLAVPSQVTALTQVETGLAVAFPVDLGAGTTRLRLGLSDIWTDGSPMLEGHRGEVSVMLRHRMASGGEVTLRLARDGLGLAGFKATRAALNYDLRF